MKLIDIRRRNLRKARRVLMARAARKRRETMRRRKQDTSKSLSKGHDCGQTLNPCSPSCKACAEEQAFIDARLRFTA